MFKSYNIHFIYVQYVGWTPPPHPPCWISPWWICIKCFNSFILW